MSRIAYVVVRESVAQGRPHWTHVKRGTGQVYTRSIRDARLAYTAMRATAWEQRLGYPAHPWGSGLAYSVTVVRRDGSTEPALISA